MIMKKHWIYFDLDGTLTDPMVGITSAVRYALSKYGIEVQYLKELIPFIGPPLKDSFMEYYGLTEEEAIKAIEYYREYYGPKGLLENEVYPGMKEMLVHLEEAGFELAVATSKPTEYSEQILKHFGLIEHFAVVVGSEFDGRRTDKAEVIQETMKRTGANHQEVIMVGDRKHDILGARRFSIDTIGVAYGYGGREELKKAGATYVVDTVEELEAQIMDILQRENQEERRLMSWKRNQKEVAPQMVHKGPVTMGIIGGGKAAEKFYQANKFGRNLTFTEDFDEAQAIFICSDMTRRYADCKAVLEEGKHVICEAPMALSVEEIESLYDLAEEKNVILLEGIPSIYTPSFEKMLPYLRSLGKVRHATFQNCNYTMTYERYKHGVASAEFDQQATGGAVMELGVYPVACMIRLFGAPKSVHAIGTTLADGMNISGTILMEYDGMAGEVIYSKVSDSSMPSQIQGEEGSMLVREITNIKDLRISRRKVDQAIHFEQSDNIYQHETAAFLKMLETGMGMESNREMSVEVMKVLEEARRQMES